MTLREHLPPDARRRLGRIKRAVLDQPEPAPKRKPKPKQASAKKPRPAPAAATPAVATGVADPAPDLSRLELRRRSVLASSGPDSSIIEIGPAHNPILPRRDGYRTKNVDYLDRDGLIDKYKAHANYDPADIEDVDYVLRPGAEMGDEVGERFDLVLASHVIEHTTSLIHFINECERLLAPGGTIALVVPDHRFCFDRFRQRSSLGRIIDAADNPPSVHSVGTMIDFSLNAAQHRGSTSWKPDHRGNYDFVNQLGVVKSNAERSRTSADYIDMHNWVFSPNYLRLVLHDLESLGYVSVRESYFHPTVGHEFFLNLTSGGTGPGLTRRELVDLADAELRTLDVPTWAEGV